MKKIILFLILASLSNAAERRVYLTVPNTLSTGDLNITGIHQYEDDSGYLQSEVIQKAGNTVSEGVPIEVEDHDYGGELKTLEIILEGYDEDNPEGIKEEDNVKVSFSYKLPDSDSYAYITTADAKDDPIIQNKFDTTQSLENLIDASDFTYDTFPGYVIEDTKKLSGVVVGREEVSLSTEPSNIMDKFEIPFDPEDEVNDVNSVSGLSINPNNSKDNNEFELYDENGQLIYIMKKDIGVSYDPEPVILNELDKNEILPIVYQGYADKMVIRFKGQGKITINGVEIDVSDGDRRWVFTNLEDITIGYDGTGNNFTFEFSGSKVGITPPPGVVIPPVPKAAFVTGTPLAKTNFQAGMTTEAQNTSRERISDIKINILNKSESFQVDGIAE